MFTHTSTSNDSSAKQRANSGYSDGISWARQREIDSAFDVVTEGKTDTRPAVSIICRLSAMLDENFWRSLTRPFDCKT